MTSSESPDPRVLELYKLSVEMADRVSARRATANAFFLTVNTALVALIGLNPQFGDSWLLPTSVCLAGCAVSFCWWLLLRNYRRLNEAKFAVINRIEEKHFPVQPFQEEWHLQKDSQGDLLERHKRKHLGKIRMALRELGTVERFVPLVFGGLYVLLLVGVFTS